jgi:hypothetical protein
MKQILLVGIIAIAIIAILLVFAVMFGYIDNPLGGMLDDMFPDSDDPPSSEYCDFSEGQILEMIELIAGKNLDNGIGIGFVRSMDMEACGTNHKTPEEIREHYTTLYADEWYIITNQVNSGAGWIAYGIAWGNDPVPASSTWVKSIITGGGTAVNTWYGYDTVTITGEGTSITYLAFANWLVSS